MTKLLDHAVETVRTLPPKVQDELARLLLQLAGQDQSIYVLSPNEEADLNEADAEVARGELATDDEVRAIWSKHGL